MEQLPQVVQAAGDRALVGVGVLQVLIWNVSACQKGAFGLLQVALVHQDDSCVQVCRCEEEAGILFIIFIYDQLGNLKMQNNSRHE